MLFLLNLSRDLVLAARSLARARAFTFVCVLSLGIGMAPVIGIPYWIRGLTTPPPGLDTDTLIEIVTTRVGPHPPTADWSYPDYVDLRNANLGASLTGWAIGRSRVRIPASGEVKRADTMYVSANYLKTMGVAPARGPGFGSNETSEPVVILTYAFWQTYFGSDPAMLGQDLVVEGIPHRVVGILPEYFDGHTSLAWPELFLPLERHPRALADSGVRFDRTKAWIRIHGRLAGGTTAEQASAAVAALTSQLAREYASTNEHRAGVANPYFSLGSLELPEFNVMSKVMQAATLLPLLVVCLNISGMVQVRGAIRERELSIRQAIGATRRRLVQHLLAESVVLALLGGSLAALVIFNLPPIISWWLGEPIPVRMQEALRVDVFMIALCVSLCLATSLLFGWLPATRFSRPTILTVLKDEAGTGGIRAGRVHRVAIALQVAIAVPLLVMSGMSLDRVRATAAGDLGFAADLLYAAPVDPGPPGGKGGGFRIRTVRDNLVRTAGVTAVTVADGLPLDFRYRMARVALMTGEHVDPNLIAAHVTRVGDGYLETMGIRLLRGRSITRDDGPGAEMVTVVSKALAERLVPDAKDGDVVGRKIMFGPSNEAREEGKPARTNALTIVGVTADFPTSQMSTEREQLLVPLAQHADVLKDGVPVEDDRGGSARLMIVARSAGGEPAPKMTAALENAMRDIDPHFEAASISTGVELRENSMSDFLTQSAVSGLSGGVILLLAALGIYGVVGMMVATRTREIAVRVALGASRLRVMGLIVVDVLKLIAPGLAVGLVITTAAVRLNGGILGVPLSRLEPIAYIVGSAVVVVIAVLASLAPARRAASVQPMVAMRSN